MSERRVVIVGAGVRRVDGGRVCWRRPAWMSRCSKRMSTRAAALGTFYHQGYRFDAGATLAAGFGADGGMERFGEGLGITWPVVHPDIAMQVHLPDDDTVTRWTDAERWREARVKAFGIESEPFWRWQESTADLLWDAILRVPLEGLPWPPASGREWGKLVKAGAQVAAASRERLPLLALDALRPVSARMGGASHRLRSYVDGQLLISAQATSGARQCTLRGRRAGHAEARGSPREGRDGRGGRAARRRRTPTRRSGAVPTTGHAGAYGERSPDGRKHCQGQRVPR